MARVRQLKPDFFKDEDLASRSHAARLLFQGLWTLADRRGRLEDRPLKIKAEVFPYEQVDVDGLLAELAVPKAHGQGVLIVRYEVGGRKYIQITGFERHQHCHPKEPESTFPGPNAAGNGEQRHAAAGNGQAMPGTSESVPSVPSESVPSESTTPPPNPHPSPAAASGGRADRQRRQESREVADELDRYWLQLARGRIRPATAAEKAQWRRVIESGRHSPQELQGSISLIVRGLLLEGGHIARDAPWPPPGLAPYDARGSPEGPLESDPDEDPAGAAEVKA